MNKTTTATKDTNQLDRPTFFCLRHAPMATNFNRPVPLCRRAHELDDTTRALEREFVQELKDLEVREAEVLSRSRLA